MVLLLHFCNKLALQRLLPRSLRLSRSHADYGAADIIGALLDAIMAGRRRIHKRAILQYNGTFLSLLGVSQFPDQSTLRRFLKGMRPWSVRQLVSLHDQLRGSLGPDGEPPFDLHSVLLTVYGKQQFARVGYNPQRRGRSFTFDCQLLTVDSLF